MTPKEKAIELVDKFLEIKCYNTRPVDLSNSHAKQCAMTCVKEIDSLIQRSTPKDDPYANLQAFEYWNEVKQEIEKL